MIQEQLPTKGKTPWPVVTMENLGENYGPGPRIKVKVIDPRGTYYDFLRRREGDVFYLIPMYTPVIDSNTGKAVIENGEVKKRLVTAEEQFSSNVMEKVDDDEPVKVTTAQIALNNESDKIVDGKTPRRK
jgi:hypothetical protein